MVSYAILCDTKFVWFRYRNRMCSFELNRMKIILHTISPIPIHPPPPNVYIKIFDLIEKSKNQKVLVDQHFSMLLKRPTRQNKNQPTTNKLNFEFVQHRGGAGWRYLGSRSSQYWSNKTLMT